MTHSDETPTTADEAGPDSPEPDSPAEPDSGTRRGLITGIAIGAVILALAVATGFTASWYVSDRDREQLDAQYVDAARQGVLNVISVSADRADRDVDRILEGSTGEFRADFAGRSKDFIDVVKQMKVTSKGTVNAVGIETSDEHAARLLVSATSLVTNGSGAQEEPRVWRLRVHLQHGDDRILIEKVDFAV
ncbi:hypothetical protein L5G32_13355 [Gordonia sp. HY002]|uniref:hypothetical protein n=1 Tax=Gordonia zhenghanii TaxID=2911516 RepID=UPI001EF07EA3|nr:hypothetical protein [Gordonia zhenghanii]MCF8571255.1 hypothetical protein [Gordonia zhenghanii]MCF8601779.1 hypothetical protein [Gordonia zhenghanii]